MARYIDADQLIKKIYPIGIGDGKYTINAKAVAYAIANIPTADVVPKSEVDSEIKVWQELYADTVSKWEKAYEELEIKLENARAEVAREIFEEIEKVREDCTLTVDDRCYFQLSRFEKNFAELKKKYTEEGG